MSKELTPLEAVKKLRQNWIDETHLFDDELLDIIETALKNYEEGLDNAKTYVKHTSSQALYDLLGLALKNVHKSYWKLPHQLYDDVKKSLKAIEIIKECLVSEFKLFEKDGEYFILFYFDEIHQLTFKLKGKEEYELLKEVLL